MKRFNPAKGSLAALVGLFLLIAAVGVLIASGLDSDTRQGQSDSSGLAGESLTNAMLSSSEEKEPSVSSRFVFEEGVTLDPQVQELIKKFLDTFYYALASLETRDLTAFFDMADAESNENAHINQAVLDYLVRVRSLQPNDLRMTSCSYTLTVTCISAFAGGGLEIEFYESVRMNFAFTPQVDSYSSGIRHTLVAKKLAGNWILCYHEKDEDVYTYVEDVYTAVCEQSGSQAAAAAAEMAKETVRQMAEYAESCISDLLAQRGQFWQKGAEYFDPGVECDNEYDREAAVAYAFQWVSPDGRLRNPRWAVYDDYGGNCNNFVSQCLYAGGIPMDIYGLPGLQWKWYGEESNGSQTARGRSSSWTGVNEFYEYAYYNYGYGLSGWAGDNVYSGQVGDVLQFGTSGGWNHSVIITGIVRDEKGNIVDYLINSNTTDRINYPASAYAYPNMRLIRILGWNNG